MKELATIECECGCRLKVMLLNPALKYRKPVRKICVTCKEEFETDVRKSVCCSKRCAGNRKHGLFPLSDEEVIQELAELGTWAAIGRKHGFKKSRMDSVRNRIYRTYKLSKFDEMLEAAKAKVVRQANE